MEKMNGVMAMTMLEMLQFLASIVVHDPYLES